jgi:pre-mRNA-splicing factor SYF1
MFNYYIARAVNFFGLTHCRPIYEKAIETLPDKQAKEMSLRFADLELKLGEIDRARAIYGYASQFCDPRIDGDLWDKWQDFETQHGNEETFKEMLRIRRTILAKFNNAPITLVKKAVESAENGSSNTVPFIGETMDKPDDTPEKQEDEKEPNDG